MFQNLGAGSPLYVFFKKDSDACVGEVCRVENIVDQYGNRVFSTGLMQPKPAFVDIVVRLNGDEQRFSHVGAELCVTDSGADGVIISDSRQEFLAAISAYMKTSERILSEVDRHKSIVEKCGAILNEYDPQRRAEKEQAEEISRLKSSMETLRNDMTDIKGMLSQALLRNQKTKEA